MVIVIRWLYQSRVRMSGTLSSVVWFLGIVSIQKTGRALVFSKKKFPSCSGHPEQESVWWFGKLVGARCVYIWRGRIGKRAADAENKLRRQPLLTGVRKKLFQWSSEHDKMQARQACI